MSVAESPSRILIVRPSALGDVSRTVPALVTLRQAYPHAQIDWLVAQAFADVIRSHPMLDGVTCFARDQLSKFGLSPAATRQGLALHKQLRSPHYDVVYDLQGLFRSGLFTWLTRAPRRVGFTDAREGGWLGYNVRHDLTNTPHTVDRMLGLLQADGLTPVYDMRLYLSETDQTWLTQWREQTGIGDGDYACLAPTARWACKCWPIERYADIARKLLDTQAAGKHLVILASPSERTQIQPLLDAIPDSHRDHVHCPTTSVGQMMAILSDTRLLVCNDSAPLHIAVGFDRPIVTIFGPTDPAHVGPYRKPHTVIQPPEAATLTQSYRSHRDDQTLISKVPVEQVWQKIQTHCDQPSTEKNI